jgi:ketosteroid isomerase-like protein
VGQARELMDRVTGALLSKDLEKLRDLYAPHAIAVTPDAGELQGPEAIIEYFRAMDEAFPTMSYESVGTYESGDCAIDQGDMLAHNTGPIHMPDGTTLPATGKQVRVRSIDIATVHDGKIVRHEWYWDQLELLVQLGLLEAPAQTTTQS